MIKLKDCSTMQLLPEAIREDPCVQAAAYALSKTAAMLMEKIDRTSVYAAVDIMPEEIVDLLAEEFRAQYYDTTLEVETKRKAVKKALLWYEKAGTLKTVKELTELVFGENVISEWFEHDGRPYTFWLEVMALDAWMTDKKMEDFYAALQKVKNTRSLLDRIIFHRRMDTKVFSGAVPDSYRREVIVDFFEKRQEDDFKMYSGAYQESYIKRSVVDI